MKPLQHFKVSRGESIRKIRTLHAFYATAGDMEPALTEIERASIEYVQCGMFLSREVIRYSSATATPNFGKSTGRAAEHDYLVVPRDALIDVREVPQRRGGVRYFIDSSTNHGVVFRPGGLATPGGRIKEECLVAGTIGTAWTDDVSLSIWMLFSKFFFTGFVKIGAYRVGPEAMRLLHARCRLTPDASWNRTTDLNPALIGKR
jgi:hypothetical protein